MESLKRQLLLELAKIPNLEDRPSPVAGGSALFYKDKEFAHFHNDNELDLRLGKRRISQEALVHPKDSLFHPKRSAGSPWIELRFNNEDDVGQVVRLVRIAVEAL